LVAIRSAAGVGRSTDVRVRRGGLLGRVRSLFVLFVAVVLFVELIELVDARTPWWPHRAVALLCLVGAGWWSMTLHRRGTSTVVLDLLPIAAVLGVGIGLGRHGAVLALLIGASQHRALFGTRRSVAVTTTGMLAAYLAVGMVLEGAGHLIDLGNLVVVSGIGGIVVVMRRVAEAMAWHDLAAVCDGVLTDAGAEFLAAVDVEEVDEVVDEALAAIATRAPRASGGLWDPPFATGVIPSDARALEGAIPGRWPDELAGLERNLRRLATDAALARERIESEHRYRVLAERSREGIYLLELGTPPVYRYLNPAAEDMLGLSTATVQRHPGAAFERVHPEDREVITAARADRGYFREPVQVRMTRDDGSMLWVEAAEGVIESRDGAPFLVQGVVRDVTRQRAQEEALQRALEQELAAADELRHLDQMKSTFLQAVSHELRTPLTAVLGSAETLRDRRDELSDADTDLLVHAVARQAGRLGRLLEDLLDVDRLSRGLVVAERAPTDLQAVVAAALEGLGEERTRVEATVEPIVARLDGPQVERIVENLLRNAIRHTPPGTAVRLDVREQLGVTVLTVEDDGPGLPDELRGSVFEPFTQGPQATAAPSPGTGIGLALVQKLAELHRGEAWVEEAPSGGARFLVVLPGPVVEHDNAWRDRLPTDTSAQRTALPCPATAS
jgi:PAS domain S-box-containing protein